MRTRLFGVALLGTAAVASSASSVSRVERSEKAAAVAPAVALVPIAGPLTGITAITHAGDGRLFITLQRGRILVWDGALVLPTPFLDISARIVCCGERGLLSTAFHPSYAGNGFFFVNYTDLQGDTVIARYTVAAGDPNVADPASGVTLLTVDQPFANHNGGQLQFGPDGQLYVGMGDGGSANDPQCFAQRREPQAGRRDLLGKLLRIDVGEDAGAPPYYGIPAGNPFVSTGGPDEAWAIGLRNPWRFSFDRLTGDLFIGDVGQGAIEEIDSQPSTSGGGQNYGWKMMEGTDCTGNTASCPPVPPCDSPPLTPPILEYSHGGGRCSVTGGYVYRGLRIPDLYGRYVYGDYCSGEIWAAAQSQGEAWSSEPLPIAIDSLTTFGEDAAGELYVGTASGNLYRIDPVGPQTPVIESITPGRGYVRGSDAITITGSGFAAGVEVLFGSAPAASVTLVSPTELRVLTPTLPEGVFDVRVTNPGAPPAVELGGFVSMQIPRVTPPAGGARVVTRPSP